MVLVDAVGILDGLAGEDDLVIDLLLLVHPPAGIGRIELCRSITFTNPFVAVPGEDELQVRLVVVSLLHANRVGVIVGNFLLDGCSLAILSFDFNTSCRNVIHEVVGILEEVAGTVAERLGRGAPTISHILVVCGQGTAEGSVFDAIRQVNAGFFAFALGNPGDDFVSIGLVLGLDIVFILEIHGNLGGQALEGNLGVNGVLSCGVQIDIH